jgi:hypothetical protein
LHLAAKSLNSIRFLSQPYDSRGWHIPCPIIMRKRHLRISSSWNLLKALNV